MKTTSLVVITSLWVQITLFHNSACIRVLKTYCILREDSSYFNYSNYRVFTTVFVDPPNSTFSTFDKTTKKKKTVSASAAFNCDGQRVYTLICIMYIDEHCRNIHVNIYYFLHEIIVFQTRFQKCNDLSP